MRQELGKYFLDLSKLVFGGIVLSQILDMTENKMLILLFGTGAVIIFAIIGILFFIIKNRKS